jgi:MmyB-like transcription regulator ligand binding domain
MRTIPAPRISVTGRTNKLSRKTRTGDEQRGGYTTGRGIGEKGEPERTGHRYHISHDDLLWLTMLASPEMAAARQAVERVLKGHEPFPALAVDRHWQLVSANAAVAPLLAGVDEALLKPPVNVLRLSLHPGGLAPRIANLAEWRTHLLMRLRTQIEQTADAVLIDLLAELSKFPATNMLKARMPPPRDGTAGVFVPFQLVTDAGKLSFLSTTTVFGTPIDVTLSELALECFFPADEATAQALHQ